LISLIDADHNMEMAARVSAASPFVQQSAEEVQSDFWKKNVLLSYVQPIYQNFIISAIDMVKEAAAEITPVNQEDGKTISETKVQDFMPLKVNA
jgi:hypothetical protein